MAGKGRIKGWCPYKTNLFCGSFSSDHFNPCKHCRAKHEALTDPPAASSAAPPVVRAYIPMRFREC